MFIVGKQRTDGSIVFGTPPVQHMHYIDARAEAERLAGLLTDAAGYIVFAAQSLSERQSAPVRTTMLAQGAEPLR